MREYSGGGEYRAARGSRPRYAGGRSGLRQPMMKQPAGEGARSVTETLPGTRGGSDSWRGRAGARRAPRAGPAPRPATAAAAASGVPRRRACCARTSGCRGQKVATGKSTMDNTTRSPRVCARVIAWGPRRKPGASRYARKRFSLCVSTSARGARQVTRGRVTRTSEGTAMGLTRTGAGEAAAVGGRVGREGARAAASGARCAMCAAAADGCCAAAGGGASVSMGVARTRTK